MLLHSLVAEQSNVILVCQSITQLILADPAKGLMMSTDANLILDMTKTCTKTEWEQTHCDSYSVEYHVGFPNANYGGIPSDCV